MASPLGVHATPRLERRAEATTYQVDDLLAEVRQGRLRMPNFQRGMRWKNQDRVDLFDSLYRGFPIGTLLFWKHGVEAGEVRFGDLVLSAGKRADGFLIVDGQQRVTTLASALLATRAPGDRAIHFDLESDEFRYSRIREVTMEWLPGTAPPTREIPVHDLFDSSRLIQWIARRTRDFPSLLIDRALECGKRLREYRVPVYVVDTNDEDVLRTIFHRTNRTGVRLDDADVFTALFATIRPEEESVEVSLQRVARSVAQLGFGVLGPDTVLKTLRAVCGLPVDKDFTKSMKRADVSSALARTEAALTRAVRFLIVDARIPHADLCPYELPIVLLSRFLDAFPDPHTRNRILLRRWLWRGSLAGRLGGASGGASASLRQHLDAVVADESETVQRILHLAEPASTDIHVSFDPFSLRTAKSQLAVCGLAALEPRDLRTGEPIDIAAIFDASSGSLPTLVKPDPEKDGLVRSVVNRLLHPQLSPTEIRRALVGASPDVLASHAVTPEAQAAIERNDFNAFLELRRDRLTDFLGTFYRKEAEIDADDSPPLDAITVEEDA